MEIWAEMVKEKGSMPLKLYHKISRNIIEMRGMIFFLFCPREVLNSFETKKRVDTIEDRHLFCLQVKITKRGEEINNQFKLKMDEDGSKMEKRFSIFILLIY